MNKYNINIIYDKDSNNTINDIFIKVLAIELKKYLASCKNKLSLNEGDKNC